MKYDNTDSNSTLKHICNIQTKLYNTNWAVEQPGQINHETMRVLSSIIILNVQDTDSFKTYFNAFSKYFQRFVLNNLKFYNETTPI